MLLDVSRSKRKRKEKQEPKGRWVPRSGSAAARSSLFQAGVTKPHVGRREKVPLDKLVPAVLAGEAAGISEHVGDHFWRFLIPGRCILPVEIFPCGAVDSGLSLKSSTLYATFTEAD